MASEPEMCPNKFVVSKLFIFLCLCPTDEAWPSIWLMKNVSRKDLRARGRPDQTLNYIPRHPGMYILYSTKKCHSKCVFRIEYNWRFNIKLMNELYIQINSFEQCSRKLPPPKIPHQESDSPNHENLTQPIMITISVFIKSIKTNKVTKFRLSDASEITISSRSDEPPAFRLHIRTEEKSNKSVFGNPRFFLGSFRD